MNEETPKTMAGPGTGELRERRRKKMKLQIQMPDEFEMRAMRSGHSRGMVAVEDVDNPHFLARFWGKTLGEAETNARVFVEAMEEKELGAQWLKGELAGRIESLEADRDSSVVAAAESEARCAALAEALRTIFARLNHGENRLSAKSAELAAVALEALAAYGAAKAGKGEAK
jgi:hypothetical protein